MFKCLKKKPERQKSGLELEIEKEREAYIEKEIKEQALESMGRNVVEAIVHCSATPDIFRPLDSDSKRRWWHLDAKEIKRWHVKDNGWTDIGYHYVIKRNGDLELGRPLSKAGAHCYGRNHASIGICLVGSHKYTDEQKETLQTLYKQLASRFGLGTDKWRCHNEFANKDCPGFTVQALHTLLDSTKYNLNEI